MGFLSPNIHYGTGDEDEHTPISLIALAQVIPGNGLPSSSVKAVSISSFLDTQFAAVANYRYCVHLFVSCLTNHSTLSRNMLQPYICLFGSCPCFNILLVTQDRQTWIFKVLFTGAV